MYTYDLAHVAGWDPYILYNLANVGLDLPCKVDPAQPLTTAGEGLQVDDLDHDLSVDDLSEVHACD